MFKDIIFGAISGIITGDGWKSLLGRLWTSATSQATAADANVILLGPSGVSVCSEPRKIASVYVTSQRVAAADETMTVNIETSINGGASWTSILTGAHTINTALGAGRKDITALVTNARIPALALVRAVFDYTAGTGPTPLSNIQVEVIAYPNKDA